MQSSMVSLRFALGAEGIMPGIWHHCYTFLSFKTWAFFKLRVCCKHFTAYWIQVKEDLVLLPSNSCNLNNFLIGKNKPIVLCSVSMFVRRPKLSHLLKYPGFQGQHSGSFSQPFCWQYLLLQLILPSTQFIELINQIIAIYNYLCINLEGYWRVGSTPFC